MPPVLSLCAGRRYNEHSKKDILQVVSVRIQSGDTIIAIQITAYT